MLVNTQLSAAEQQAANAMVQHVMAGPVSKLEQKVQENLGRALAETAIAEARHQGSAWGRVYRSMLQLEAEGRAGFRSEIAAHQKAMQGHVKAASVDGPNKVYETTKRSAMVRLSELTTISKALDAGGDFEPDWPFHYAVGQARTLLNSLSMGSTKGRKATPWMDKVKKYLTDNVPEGEWSQCLEMVETLAKIKE